MEKNGKEIKKGTGSLASLVVGIDPGKGGGMAVIKSHTYDFGAKIFTTTGLSNLFSGTTFSLSIKISEPSF